MKVPGLLGHSRADRVGQFKTVPEQHPIQKVNAETEQFPVDRATAIGPQQLMGHRWIGQIRVPVLQFGEVHQCTIVVRHVHPPDCVVVARTPRVARILREAAGDFGMDGVKGDLERYHLRLLVLLGGGGSVEEEGVPFVVRRDPRSAGENRVTIVHRLGRLAHVRGCAPTELLARGSIPILPQHGPIGKD